MRARLLVPLLALVLSPAPAHAAQQQCVGFLNQTEQGYTIADGSIEPSGPTVSAGTELEFNGLVKVEGRLFLTRARSDVVFDSEHVELPESCDLPVRPPPRAP